MPNVTANLPKVKLLGFVVDFPLGEEKRTSGQVMLISGSNVSK